MNSFSNIIYIKILLSVLILGDAFSSLGQNEEKNWHFGNNTLGLHFNGSINPSISSNTYVPFGWAGCSVANDPVTGNLLFYSDGQKAIDKNHNAMPNGSGLNGGNSTHSSGKICPKPGNCNKYYIFSIATATETQSISNLYYSIVDLSLAGNGTPGNPMGNVVSGQKNIQVSTDVSESLEIIPRTGTHEFWLISPKYYTSEIDIFLISSTGISLQSSFTYSQYLSDLQAIRYSPANGKLAVGSFRENDPVLLFDFNSSSGTLSNVVNVPGTPIGNSSNLYSGIIDLEWSPDGTKLYLSKYRGYSPSTGGKLYQYDLNIPSQNVQLVYSISNLSNDVAKGLRTTPTGMVYWMYYNPTLATAQYIAAVQAPNQPVATCNFNSTFLNTGINLTQTGLFPNFSPSPNSSFPIDITANISIGCNAIIQDTTLNIESILAEPENDNLLVNLVSASFGSATFQNSEIQYHAPVVSNGSDTLIIHFCDDYCSPRCGQMRVIIHMRAYANHEIFENSNLTCSGSSALIGPDISGYTFEWNTGDTTEKIIVDQSGLYIYQAFSDVECDFTDTIEVFLQQLNANTFFSDSILICNQSEFLIQTPWTNYSIEWNTGDTTNYTLATASGTYSFNAVSHIGCIVSDSLNLDFYTTPHLLSSSPNTMNFCGDQPVTIEVTSDPNADISWSTGIIDNQITISQSDSIEAYASNICGVDTMQFVVIFSDLPNVDLGNDIFLCDSTSITLSASEELIFYDWSTTEQTASIVVNQSGNYALTSTNACGVDSDTIFVAFNYSPEIVLNVPSDLILCDNASMTIQANSLFSSAFEWSTGETTDSITINQPGDYFASTINMCGTDTAYFEIASGSSPNVHLGEDILLCDSLSMNLTADSTYDSLLWSTNEETPIITIDQSGMYWLTATNDCGSATDTIIVALNHSPQIAVSSENNFVLCDNESILVYASGNDLDALMWSNGTSENPLIINQPGDFFVTVENACGIDSASFVVSASSSPMVDLGADLHVCSLTDLFLTGDISLENYVWSTGEETMAIHITEPGNYWLYTSNNCGSDSDTISVTIETIPELIPSNGLSLCENETALIACNYTAESYSWSTGATTPEIEVSQAGWYILDVTSALGCSHSDSILINVIVHPPLLITESIHPCNDELSAGTGEYSVLWSTGENTSTILVYDAGYYEATITYADQCEQTGGINVTWSEKLSSPDFLPNIFTPNGDGKNDFFTPFEHVMDCVTNMKISIFNRWGQEMYSTTNPNFAWNGMNSNGNAIEEGTYFCAFSYDYIGEHFDYDFSLQVSR